MRMKNMYFICKKNLSTIKDFTYTEESVAGGFKNRIVNNYTLINHALTELYEIDCLKSSIDIILGICTTFHRPKCYYIYNDDYGKFVEQVKLLANSMQTIVDLGNDFDFEDCESGFDIKLPSGLSFSDLSSCITDINKALEQCPYLHESDEKIEFKSLDVGSEWLSFTTECTAVGGIIVVFSKIVDKAVQIASHIVTVQQQHEQYKTLKLQNGLLDSIVSANTIVTNSLVEKCAQELQQDIHTLSPDDNERLKYSLKNLSDWMSKGMEIYSCIEAPAEIQNLFPTQTQQRALTFNKKELPKNETDTEE